MIIVAGRPGGPDASTVRIDDAVWAQHVDEFRALAAERPGGYLLSTLPYAEAGQVERNCDDAAAVREWIGTLDEEDE